MDRIEYYEDARGEWRWRLRASNGRIVADSGEGYASKGSVRRAVRRMLWRLVGPVEVSFLTSGGSFEYDATLSRVRPLTFIPGVDPS